MGRGVFVVLAAILAACSSSEQLHPNDLTIRLEADEAPVALSARLDVAVVDACQAPASACKTDRCCTTQTIDSVSARTDDPIATVEIGDGRLSVFPTAGGNTTLRVTATLGGATAEATRAVQFLQADRIELDAPQAIRPSGRDDISACLPPVRMEVGARGFVPYRAYAGATWLATTGMQPFALDGDAITLGEPGGLPRFGFVYFDAARPGTARARTTIGEPATVAFEIAAAGAIDGIDMAPTGEIVLPGSDTVDVDVFVTAEGRRLCADLRERVVIIETPTYCRFDAVQGWPHDGGATTARPPAGVLCLRVQGITAGTCRLRAGIVDTNLEDVLEISVR